MVNILLLERDCRIVFDIIKIGLKNKTGVFDYLFTDTLTEINYVLKNVLNNVYNIIEFKYDNHFIKGTNIKTSHYTNTDYQSIFNRRLERFIYDIKNNNEILFIRDDILNNIQLNEIEEFILLIKNFNSNINFKILLLSDNKIIYDNLIHKKYDNTLLLDYINECFPK